MLLSATHGGANELAAHGWDIAAALDLRRAIPDHVAAALLTLAETHLTAAERGTHFAPPVPVPVTASPSDRFVAHLGRQWP